VQISRISLSLSFSFFGVSSRDGVHCREASRIFLHRRLRCRRVDGRATSYTSSPPLRAFPRERATRAEKSPGTTGADRRKALPLPSIIRPSRFPWPRKSPRDWKCSRRRCDDREEGRDARARASERGERPSWKPGADGRAFDRPSA